VNEADIVHICAQALVLAAKLAGPLLGVALALGVLISLVQVVFQVQDQTVAMVPKLAVGGAVLALTAGWMLRTAVDFTSELWSRIPDLVH
jgi:flagellar biosynthetic protein FliQ